MHCLRSNFINELLAQAREFATTYSYENLSVRALHLDGFGKSYDCKKSKFLATAAFLALSWLQEANETKTLLQ